MRLLARRMRILADSLRSHETRRLRTVWSGHVKNQRMANDGVAGLTGELDDTDRDAQHLSGLPHEVTDAVFRPRARTRQRIEPSIVSEEALPELAVLILSLGC